MHGMFGPGPLDEEAAREAFESMASTQKAMFELSLGRASASMPSSRRGSASSCAATGRVGDLGVGHVEPHDG